MKQNQIEINITDMLKGLKRDEKTPRELLTFDSLHNWLNSICLTWEIARHDMIWTVSGGAVLSWLVVDSSEDFSSEHNTGLRRAAAHTTTGFSGISCHKADVSLRHIILFLSREKKVTNHCDALKSSEARDCWMNLRKENQSKKFETFQSRRKNINYVTFF